jgi:hypothetical protein
MAAGFVRSGIWVALVVVAATLSPSEYLARAFGEESRIGSLIVQYLVPAYQQLVVDHPDLRLPAIPDVELPPAADHDGGGPIEPAPDADPPAADEE